MPFELGLFLGAQRFGDVRQRAKTCLVLDAEPYRYQKFISDLAGADIYSHDNEPRAGIRRVRDWLRAQSGSRVIPGGATINRRYEAFSRGLPRICRDLRIAPAELTFVDYTHVVVEWLKLNAS